MQLISVMICRLRVLAGAMIDARDNNYTFRVATDSNIEGKNLGENEWVVMLFTTVVPDGAVYNDITNTYDVVENGVTYHYGKDYHWYRQNAGGNGEFNGTWSHKPGNNTVKNVDSSGRIINDPRLANRRTEFNHEYDSNGKLISVDVLDYNNYVGAYIVGY